MKCPKCDSGRLTLFGIGKIGEPFMETAQEWHCCKCDYKWPAKSLSFW